MRSTAVLLIVLAAVPAASQQQPNLKSADPAEKCSISGTVTDAGTGQPLPRAEITLYKQGRRGAAAGGLTDASGRFDIENLDPGRYSVTVSHTDYIAMQHGGPDPDSPDRMLTLIAGQKVSDISFRLLREAVITGHVYDEDSNPIQGAQVQAFIYGYSGGKRQLLFSASAQTDDRGQFRLYDLAPGTYYIRADAGPAPFGAAASISYPRSYYPGVADPSAASPITVGAGNEYPGVDFSLQTIGTFHIRGRVTGAVVGPHTNINVELDPKYRRTTPMPNETNPEGPDGDFDFSNVRPGSYEVTATAWISDQDRRRTLQASQPIEVVDSDVNGVNLALAPGATLRGRVVVEGQVDISNLDLWLEPQGLASYGISGATVQANGSFEFRNLMDGSYRVEFLSPLPPNAFLKSATLDGQDVLESGIQVSNGQAAGSMLDIVVSGNGGQISGVVMKDGKPFDDARVTLVPADDSKLSDALWFKETTTDQNGNFLLQGIRPGTYRVFAWQKIEPGQDRDPDFIERFKDKGQQVQVMRNSAVTLQLEAIPASARQPVKGQ